MDIWKHCRLSVRKFGGEPEDYVGVHRFIDHSKLYLYHFRHRLLLHSLFGVELAIERLGDFVARRDGGRVLVRDVAAAHCAEDLSGRVPTLHEWLGHVEDVLAPHFEPIDLGDAALTAFVQRPYLRSGLRSSLLITQSDFGVGLVEQFFGFEAAMVLRERLNPGARVAKYLSAVPFEQKWMYTPDRRELAWLAEHEESDERSSSAGLRVVSRGSSDHG